jgi:hypothetical protein
LHVAKWHKKQQILVPFCTGEYISFYVDFAAAKIPCKYQILQYEFA